MARFMVSMPDDILKKLDWQARKESRSRSELLREAARRHLASAATVEAKERPTPGRNSKQKAQKRWTKKSLEQHLSEKGLARRGCPGLDSLVGPVDMKRVLRITKRLIGLSRQIIEDREDRLRFYSLTPESFPGVRDLVSSQPKADVLPTLSLAPKLASVTIFEALPDISAPEKIRPSSHPAAVGPFLIHAMKPQ